MSPESGEDRGLPGLVAEYRKRGMGVVFYPRGLKGPRDDRIVDGPDEGEPPDGSNVGIITGREVAPGRFLADVDFDWDGGLPLAKRLLPPAAFGFGRKSRPLSHVLYTIDEPLPSKTYNDVDGKHLVELRCAKRDGSAGLQTMAPPSAHPSGETIELVGDGEVPHAPGLPRAVALYATAAVLYKHLGAGAFRHDVRLSTAGFLLKAGLTEGEAIAVSEALASATGNNTADAVVAVTSTQRRLESGDKRVTGWAALASALGTQGRRILSNVREWLGGSEFVCGQDGRILANSQDNVRRALERLEAEPAYDQFAMKAMARGQALDDRMRTRLWLETDERFAFLPNERFFEAVLVDTCYANPFHPVLDYLEALVWDGTPRADEWLIRYAGAADSPYVRAVSCLPLLAAVRRVRRPGDKFDEMLVLESGTQGLLKSTALRTLCPRDEWFSDGFPLNMDTKQLIERTSGKWIIEAADLSGMSKANVEHLKVMMSQQVDGPVRMAYGRLPIERPRQFIIIGTTNSHEYLEDPTGNRRFWPVRVGKFDIAGLREARDQIWAEIVVREAKGETTRLAESLYAHAGFQQDRRRVPDAWEPIFEAKFHDPEETYRVSPDELWDALGIPMGSRDEKGAKRIHKIMQLLGFRSTTVRRGKAIVRGWIREPRTPGLPGTGRTT